MGADKQPGQKIENFIDLRVWKSGHDLVISVYKITKTFPREELFGLVNQMRRAVVSIVELQNQFLIARDVGYLPTEQFQALSSRADKTAKLLRALISKSKTFC